MRYKDPNAPLPRRIDDLLRRMTLAEKIGQMLQIERAVATPEIVKDYFIGMDSLCFLSAQMQSFSSHLMKVTCR